MFRAFSVGKKVIRKREEQKYNEAFLQRIKNTRPGTTHHGQHRLLNNGKKMMLMENKFTEIERQNRLLLQKIVAKKERKLGDGERQKMNKSLNFNFRKKQLQNIQIENARLLKRLQDRKSDYRTQKFQKQWKKQKQVIKNISNFPFVIRDISTASKKGRKRTYSKQLQRSNINHSNYLQQNIEISRLCNFKGVIIDIVLSLNQQKLTILGDLDKGKDLKVIQIQRNEALEFIDQQCDGNFQELFNRLSFDHGDRSLYLMSKDSQFEKPQRFNQHTQNL